MMCTKILNYIGIYLIPNPSDIDILRCCLWLQTHLQTFSLTWILCLNLEYQGLLKTWNSKPVSTDFVLTHKNVCQDHFTHKFVHNPLKVEALWFKSFIVFLENLVSGTFVCADDESKIKEIGWRLCFWDTDVAKTTYFLSKSHNLPHKVIQKFDKSILMYSKWQQKPH